MVGGPVFLAVRRSTAALRPVVAAVLVVLALSLTSASNLGFPAHGSGVPQSSGPGSPAAASGPVTVAPAFAPGASNTWVGPVPASSPMNVVVGLASRDPGGLEAETAAEYTVGSPLYHHFLSAAQVAARYGPTPAAVAAAERYFAGFGLLTHPLPGGSLLSVTGPASALGTAFGTSFEEYRSPTGRLFVSHPTPATLPSGVPWTGAVGLGNVSVPLPLAEPASGSASPALASPAASCAGGTSGLSPCELWTAYDSAGLIGSGTNGSGTSIGIVDVYDGAEPQTRLSSDLAKFDSTFLLPAPSVGFNYPVPTSTNPNSTSTGWGVEEALDLEWAHAAAPGASIAMTFAPDTNAGLYAAIDWLVAADRVDVLSLSWGEPDVGVFNAFSTPCSSACNASSDGSYEVLGPVLAAAALEGITVFSAAGDCGSADGTSGVSTGYPSSDPFVTGVGGTDLSIGSGGVWQGETAWSGNATGAKSPGCVNQGGSGGGFAPFPRPWWQAGPGVPSSPQMRGDPDVAADAGTAVEIIEGGGAAGVLGTSVATPLWAGVAAIADQYAGGPLGFLDPQLYTLLRSASYTTDFHDITSGNNGAYSAGTGWDPVTGVGTPIVGSLVPALSRTPPSTSSLAVGIAASPDRGSAPLSVTFFVLPTGGTGDYPLEGVDFGDGTAALASGGTASHVYTTDGVYPAVAYVADSSGNTSASAPLAVVVGGSALRVNLTVSDRTPSAGTSVQFDATVTGGTAPYTYLFAFGDGTFLNGSASNVTSHAYPVAGGYCADVVVNDSADPPGGGTSALLPISVGGASAPTCTNQTGPFRVTAEANPGVRDAPADFPPLFRVSGGEGTGTPTETLSSSDPYVAACGCAVFRAPGNYSVTMQATNSSGARASNETNVTVAPTLTGVFRTGSTVGLAPLTVNFSVALSGGYEANAARTVWAFGDGGTAVGASVSHTYDQSGFYFATGDAQDSGNGNASEGFLIDVETSAAAAPQAIVGTVQPAVDVLSGTTVNFSASAVSYPLFTPDPVLYNWSLGSGTGALVPEVGATFYTSGSGSPRSHDFSLTVTWPFEHQSVTAALSDPDFLAAQAGGFVPEANALALAADGAPEGGSAPLPWSGSATAAGPGTAPLAWDFGDGNTSTGGVADEEYGAPGVYTVNVTATDSWGDRAVVPFGVTVRPATPISLHASASPLSGAAPLKVVFSASATGGSGTPYLYSWTPDDNDSPGAAGSGWAFYNAPGTYDLSLNVTDWMGDIARENWTVVVTSNSSAPGAGGEPGYLYLGVAALVGAAAAIAVVASARRSRRGAPPTP